MTATLLTAPNVSEGADAAKIAAIGDAFATRARLLDVHSDADHHRTVYTLAGRPGELSTALLAGAAAAVELVDVCDGRGQHPHVGAVDVAPIVYLHPADRGAACAETLKLADLLGQRLRLPIFLYGQLAGGRTRAQLRGGGFARLAKRLQEGELAPDFGPPTLHPSAGATLVSARPPLVAFNVELAPPAGLEHARAIAVRIRKGGESGIDGLRAIGIALRRAPIDAATSPHVGQVSMNVEDPYRLPLRVVLAAVQDAAHALGAEVDAAEIVGLVPAAALDGFPEGVPLRRFDAASHVLENALQSVARPHTTKQR